LLIGNLLLSMKGGSERSRGRHLPGPQQAVEAQVRGTRRAVQATNLLPVAAHPFFDEIDLIEEIDVASAGTAGEAAKRVRHRRGQ